MTIEYDPETKTSMHRETGLSVQFIRRTPLIGENTDKFLLTLDGRPHGFTCTYNSGEPKLRELYPDLDLAERTKLRRELSEHNFNVHAPQRMTDATLAHEEIDMAQVFVETLYDLLRSKTSREIARTIKVRYSPFFEIGKGVWSVGRTVEP